MKKLSVWSVMLVLVSLPLYAGVDLTLANAVADPVTVKPLGTKFTIKFDLKNVGNTGYSGALAVKIPIPSGAEYANSSYSSDGTMACTPQTGQVLCSRIADAAPLAPSGGTISMRVTMKAVSAGSYSINLQADPDNAVVEDNDGNNSLKINGSMYDLPRVAVKKNTCPAYRAVGEAGGHAFTLFNVGTLDVRYPGLVFELTGDGTSGQMITVTNVIGGTILTPTGTPFALNTPAAAHKFVIAPGADKTPLLAGASAQMTFFAKSNGAQKIKVKAFIDTTAIQDTSTPADNSAECSYAVQ
jgi:hypothetical protein